MVPTSFRLVNLACVSSTESASRVTSVPSAILHSHYKVIEMDSPIHLLGNVKFDNDMIIGFGF